MSSVKYKSKKKSGSFRGIQYASKAYSKEFKDKSDKKWFSELLDDPDDFKILPVDQVNALKTQAQALLDKETANYNSEQSKSSGQSNYNWMRTIMSKGTGADKIAAYTITIQDSPVHSLPLLRNFIAMVKTGKRKECVQVLGTLTELFLSDLLRPEKKLKTFEQRPLSLLDELSSGSHNKKKTYLVLWYFEDQLKELYLTFIKALNMAAQASVENHREKAVTAIYKLLSGNPEQESILLASLVNKLGDPSQRVTSKTVYSLIQLLNVHPNMKLVVMEETEKLLFRPNVGKRTQYYGICFLSQFLLSKEEADLAKNLIRIYLSFFKACIKQGEVDSRLMSALLTGVNRAYPFAKSVMESMDGHIDVLYKVVHYGNFNVSIHTLNFIFQVADFTNSTLDRFYSALYKKLVDPQLGISSHHATFLSLVFRALKKDEDKNRVRVFIKRLLQICSYMPVQLVVGILCLISQLMKKKGDVLTCQMAAYKVFDDDADESEEYYEDVKIEDSENETEIKGVTKQNDDSTTEPTWFHCKNINGVNKKPKPKHKMYDPYERNPVYAGGEHCVHIELLKLVQHYHPTVAYFANKLLQGETFSYSGDPLLDFALPRFLDRFVFKNPKKILEKELGGSSVFSRKKSYLPSGMKSLKIDSAGYLNEEETNVPADELFLYRFLQKKRQLKEEEKQDESDASSVASEEFQEMIDNLMRSKDMLDYAEEIGKAELEKTKGSEKGKLEQNSEESDSELDENIECDGEGEDKEEEQSDESMSVDSKEEEESDEYHITDEMLAKEADSIEDEKFLKNYLLKSKKHKHSKNVKVECDESDEDEAMVFDSDQVIEDEAMAFDSDQVIEDDDDDDDDDSEEVEKVQTKKGAKWAQEQKLKRKLRGSDVFIPSEEFSEMLEEMGTVGRKMTGSSALSTKDNAGMKQLNWEASRDYWLMSRANKRKHSGGKKKWKGHGKFPDLTKKFRKK